MADTGLEVLAGEHPIVPVMVGDEKRLAPITVAAFDAGLHVVAAGIKAFEMLAGAGDLRERLAANTAHFRERMGAAGFDIKPGVHPICPVMLYDAPLAQRFAERLLEEGIYAIGFFFPVVPQGQARIRTQISAAHTREHLDRAIDAFTRIGRELKVVA
jgi:glycine C-acetyltransferase